MSNAAVIDPIRTQREALAQQRHEAYEAWEQREMSDPRFGSTRMLVEDYRRHDAVRPDTWERFDVEERTWGAEVLNAPHSHIDRFHFDGRDIIVKESDGINPALTLRDVYQKGLDKVRADVAVEPGLAFQLRRDELFMDFYEAVESMMRGEARYDTIHMRSPCPSPHELPVDYEEAMRLLNSRFYDLENRKSFDYTARRLPDGSLELSATRLDSSDLEAHAAVLQASGYSDMTFALFTSHEYGRFLSYEHTTESPIEIVIANRTALYDQAMEAKTGRAHRFGRVDDKPDAHQFFREHTEEYWAGYRGFNDLLAQHFAGRELAPGLRGYLQKCLTAQETVGQSVLSKDKLHRLRSQLRGDKITADMAMSCRELLVYDHHATLTKLYKQFCETGEVTGLDFAGGNEFMDAYADAASANGSAAAANGETFAGCETATSVSSLSSQESTVSAVAKLAAATGVSLEQALRMQEEEAAHCLRIQMNGFTIRRGVTCPFCAQKVDARDTATTIECLSDDCRTVLDKATGTTTSLRQQSANELASPIELPKLQPGYIYQVGGSAYRRTLHIVVGGARLVYIDQLGRAIEGPAAERLEAIIVGQLASAAQAA